MADALPSSERDGFEPDEGENESLSKPMHATLCNYCQALVFNERDHSDTLRDHGYRLLRDGDGRLQLEIDEHRRFVLGALGRLSNNETTDGEFPLRTQLTRKDTAPNLPSVTATAEAGCHICKCLLSRRLADGCITELLGYRPRNFAEMDLTIKFFYTWDQSSFGLRNLVADAHFDTMTHIRAREYFLVEADVDKPCAEVLGMRTNTFLPGWSFDRKVDVMREWIRNCEKSCDHERIDGTLPTRLLALNSSQGPNQHVRLIYSKDIPRSTRCKYAALSHCWGSPDQPPLKTERNSLDKMLCEIPFESLPANYRDAVQVTR